MATAPKVTAAPHDQPQRMETHKWLVALAVMLGATLEVLDTSIVNVALPHMQGSFSASVDEITWVLTSYLVANGIMIPLTGWISARFGRKRYFMASVIVFVFASGLCGAAQTLNQMVLFRLVQGAAGAAMIPSSQAILMETFPPAEQGLAMAMWGVGLMAAPVLGPTLGGWITDNWNWRWNFYINLPIGGVAAVMVFWFVHDPTYLRVKDGIKRRIDYLGIIYLTLGLGLLQIVLDRGQRADWFNAQWVCYFTAGSILAVALMIWHELRFPDPILDLTIVKIPVFNVAVMAIMAMVLILYGTNLLNPLYLQNLMGYNAWRAGIAVAPRGVGTLVALLVVGQLSRRGFDMRPWVGVGFAIVAYSTWKMSRWNLNVGTWALALPIILSGVGSGFIFPTLSATTLSCVSKERMGYAASLYNMMRNTGSAIGISIVTNMLNSREQIHQSYLVQHFSVFDAWRMTARGARMPGAPIFDLARELATSQKQGLGIVYQTVQVQASLLAFNDIYRSLAILGAICIPIFLFLRKPVGRAAAGGH